MAVKTMRDTTSKVTMKRTSGFLTPSTIRRQMLPLVSCRLVGIGSPASSVLTWREMPLKAEMIDESMGIISLEFD